MTKKNQSQGSTEHSCSSNMGVLRGLLALLGGLIFIVFAYQIILNVLLCLTGLVLIDYGLRVLHVKSVTDYIDAILAKLRTLHDDLL